MATELQLGLPFMGEEMTCVLCGCTHRSNIGISTDWRCIMVNSRSFYACPNEFPPDGAPAEDFKVAYTRVLKAIITIINDQVDST